MPSSSQTRATLIATLLALTIAAVAGVTRHQAAEAAGGPVPGIAIQRLGSSYASATGYDRYSYIIVGRSGAAAAASQPGRTLVYHSGVSVNTAWDSGVPYSVASSNGWLLTSSSGTPLRNVNYPDNYIGDVGNAAYQAEWARRVGDYLASVGADGVYIDDVIADISTMTGGAFPSRYPNQQAWENAMASFVASIGSTLRGRGLYVLVNANKFIAGNLGSNDGSLVAEWWRRLAPSVSGLMTEYFVQNQANSAQLRSTGTEWYNQWPGWQGLVAVAQNAGVDFFGLSYATSAATRELRYAKGSFLLDWDGGGGALIIESGNSDPWSSEWTGDIGQPSGAKYQVGVGWRRNFSGGTVVVNPSPSASQTFALGGSYQMPDGSTVTTVTLAATSALVLRGSSTVAVPVNTALPTVNGASRQNVLLSSTTGTWSGSPSSYAYQWTRCDTAGNACVTISGATTSQYLLAAADVGRTLRVRVTASNPQGSTPATSAATPVVAALATTPASLTSPSISGSAQVGQSLSSSPGTWTNSPSSYAHQWQRCDNHGGACAAVAGATATSFALTTADVGRSVRVVVTATNSSGSSSAASAASAVVSSTTAPPSAPANTSLPAVSGTARQGSTLQATTGSWSGSPSSYAYQWRRCDSGGGACVAINGSGSPSYALVSADVGSTIRVAVTAASSAGSATATSAPTGVVTAVAVVSPHPPSAPVNTSSPAVSGTTTQGSSLQASTGSWSGSPSSYAYQWRRCDDAGNGCSDVGGATGAQYQLGSSDVGRTMRVVVSASNSGGSTAATSAPSGVVAPLPVAPPSISPPANTEPPTVVGPEAVDRTVTSTPGGWTTGASFAYQWLRCSADRVASCNAIDGATRESYRLVAGDLGHFLIVRVTASNPAGSASATSAFGQPVKH